jgi:hypothetical protein
VGTGHVRAGNQFVESVRRIDSLTIGLGVRSVNGCFALLVPRTSAKLPRIANRFDNSL